MQFRAATAVLCFLLLSPLTVFAGSGGGDGGDDDDDDPITDIVVQLYPPPWNDPKIPDHDNLPPHEKEKLRDEWYKDFRRRRQNISEAMGVVMMGLGR